MEIRNLHFVRGLAALLVVVYHAKFVLWSGGVLYLQHEQPLTWSQNILLVFDLLSSCGKQAVILFFILSAIVIRHSYTLHHYNVLRFYSIRAIRIYLPFLFSMAFAVGALLLSTRLIAPPITSLGIREYNESLNIALQGLSLRQVLHSLFFIPMPTYVGLNYVYWSLLHEVIFYLLFPIYVLLGIRQKLLALPVLWVLYFFFRLDVFYYQAFFLIGLLYYDWFLRRRQFKVKLPVAATAITLSLAYIAINVSVKAAHTYITDAGATIFILLLFTFVLQQRVKQSSFLSKLGNISYSLYLNHLPVLLLFYALVYRLTGSLLIFNHIFYLAGVAIAVLAAYPLYLLAEKPSLLLLRKTKVSFNSNV